MASLYETCMKCGQSKPKSQFLQIRTTFFPKGYTPICIDCLEDMVEESNGNFQFMDELCRWLGIAFRPEKWIELYKANGKIALSTYVQLAMTNEYPMINWRTVYESYLDLEKKNQLDSVIPALTEEVLNELRAKWGEQYSDEQLRYLDDLYQGILQTQNVNSKLKEDDAVKVCEINLLIKEKIRAGEDFDKLLKSYDTLRKSAGFTDKDIKNACDFDSVGELFAYLERKGWLNEFYDDSPKDQVDMVMKDVQTWLRNLYKNETGIAEDVQRRIEALQAADAMEASIMAIQDDGLDDFDAAGYLDEDFNAEAGLS